LLDHLRDAGEADDFDSAECWLEQEGFVRHEQGWTCDERMLARLDRTEILSATPL
jgi:hypothetical protein